MKVRIYYHHTDCGGVVYYAEYLKFLEEARTEFLESCGVFLKDLLKRGIQFVVVEQEIRYKAPAFYGDILEIETHLNKIDKLKIEFTYEIKNQERKLISLAKTTLACVDRSFKACSLPEDMRRLLTSRK
ncbi:MAG: acyl-CoA thioesterase [Candidatus Omnitrophica bacterium]|nr:acyl-CoA thioesterase [Candidatus Omnitrophota bacterium]MCM8798850.1 acyl-CoA thioesterase [Candidatus Omnitrophota bacterium]